MKFSKSKLLNSFTNITQVFTTIASGNLAFHVNDNTLNVHANHTALASILKYNLNSLVHMKQIHSDSVHIVIEDDNYENPPICDALITDKLNIPLMVMVADCSPILFYDTKKKVIAVAHAGRQGAFKNIVKNVIDSFISNYTSDAKDIVVSIGASIGSCCYEVGNEIYEEAKELNLEYAIEVLDAKYYLNISKILKTQLLASKIESKNIEISNECSCCKSDKVNYEAREGSLGYKYFSYRADAKCGRFAGVIALN